jgi:hypothetical protein
MLMQHKKAEVKERIKKAKDLLLLSKKKYKGHCLIKRFSQKKVKSKIQEIQGVLMTLLHSLDFLS